MMWVSLLADGAGAEPVRIILPADAEHIRHTVRQVLPLFDDGAPGGPDCGFLADGEEVAEGLHVLLVEPQVALPLHIVGPGGPLGVDVEHQEGVEAVAGGDALDGFEGVVQIVGLGCRGVDAHADQRIPAPGAQDIAVLRIEIRGVEPFFDVILGAGGVGGAQSLVEGQHFDLGGV